MNTTMYSHVILVPCCHRDGAAPSPAVQRWERWIGYTLTALGLVDHLLQLF